MQARTPIVKQHPDVSQILYFPQSSFRSRARLSLLWIATLTARLALAPALAQLAAVPSRSSSQSPAADSAADGCQLRPDAR